MIRRYTDLVALGTQYVPSVGGAELQIVDSIWLNMWKKVSDNKGKLVLFVIYNDFVVVNCWYVITDDRFMVDFRKKNTLKVADLLSF